MTDHDPFYAYYASKSIGAKTLQRFAATQAAVMRAAWHFGLRQESLRVADIGCGAATQCALWAGHGHAVYGIDINEQLIALGRERARAQGLTIDLSVGSATALPWRDQSMDICLCPELLEHVTDWESCLREALRVTKVGGVLYVSTTNKLCPSQAEFDLPAYSWYPSALKRRYEHLAVTTRPELVQHARYPAVNWFTYFELRDYLGPLGMQCMDRFDVAALEPGSRARHLVLGAIKTVPRLRWLAHVMTPYSAVFAHKVRA